MNDPFFQFIAALAMAGAAVVLFFAFRHFLVANSDRRMRAMIESVGLDPDEVTNANIDTVMKEVRQRCRDCKVDDVCDRWLAGEVDGDNAFCPNARVFEVLKKYSRAA